MANGLQIEKVLKANDIEKGNLSFKYLIYEYLMTEDVFTEKIKKEQAEVESATLILNGIEAILNHPDLFSGIHFMPIKTLLESDILDSTNLVGMKGLLGANGNYYPTEVSTPNGSPIESATQWVGSDFSQSECNYIESLLEYAYGVNPDSIVGVPSLRYNCHAYAWHMSCGGSGVWINGKDDVHSTNGYYLSPYWEDGSYYECSQSDDHDVVLYAGDHSARRISNGVYESKWGNGPVIRHQLNDVASDYLPSQPKRFFKRVQLSLNGPTIPGSPSTYSVQGLPPGWYVVWSMEGQTTLPSYCTANYPSSNQLQINNSSKLHIQESLIANVYNNNGILIKSLPKYIDTASGFVGSYSQAMPLEVLSGHVYDGSSIQVNQGYNVVLTSSDFYGATVSYTSLAPYPTITTSGNTITVNLRASTFTSNCLLHCVKGDKVIEFRLRAVPSLIIDPDLPIMSNISSNGNSTITIELVENADRGDELGQNTFDSWELNITSISTGEVVCEQQISGTTVSIDSSKWKPDVYIIHIKVADKEIVQKLSLLR